MVSEGDFDAAYSRAITEYIEAQDSDPWFHEMDIADARQMGITPLPF